MVKFVLKLFLFLLLVTPVFSQEISVKAFTDSSDYLVGDHINFTLSVTYSDNVNIITPFFRDSLKLFEIIKELSAEKKKTDDKNEIVYSFVLSYFDSAEVKIPPIKIFYRTNSDTAFKSVQSDSLSIRIHKLKVNVEEDIKDIKPPVRIPFDWISLIIWILLSAILLAVIYFLYKKYFRKKATEQVSKPVIVLPPHEEALMKLDQLDREQLWQKGFVKEYHSRITEIIREYFEKRFGLPALELPTSEQLELLKRIPDAKEIYSLTESFLSNADLVKFAKFVPLDRLNAEMMKQAVEIVNKSTIKNSIVQGENGNV
uniref:Oxygen tolerance n=1 Tax=Ignavibacterium album TaxID=591197 RepID=A0A7V3E757_9BACT